MAALDRGENLVMGHLACEVHVCVDAQEHRPSRARADGDGAYLSLFSLRLGIRHLDWGVGGRGVRSANAFG